MDVTEVRIKLMDEPGERLKAFCSITFDDAFVIRDLKIIEGASGPFVAMPSRKLTAHCPFCGSKNHLRASYCNQCGKRLREPPSVRDEDGRTKLYADIAHPINSSCREMIQEKVIAAFEDEKTKAKMPGYVSRYDDIDVDEGAVGPPHRVPARDTSSTPSPPEAANSPHGQPPGPHKTADRPGHHGGPKKTDFGAGVFE